MTDAATSSAVEQIIQQRREKKERAIAAGKTPFGHRYAFTHTLAEVREKYDPLIVKEGEPGETESKEAVNLVGRMMTRRDMGKLCFAHLQDLSGKLQVKVSKQSIGEELYKEFIKELDLGDIVAVTGKITRTKTGELSLSLEKFELLSKSLRPWPEKYHGVTDVETRSRQRELDLVMTAESRERFLKRSKIIQSLRATLDKKRFIEVETPLMQAVPGGAAAKPFTTHHEALDLELYREWYGLRPVPFYIFYSSRNCHRLHSKSRQRSSWKGHHCRTSSRTPRRGYLLEHPDSDRNRQ
jgi:lysyl-tRNA synthetase class 2